MHKNPWLACLLVLCLGIPLSSCSKEEPLPKENFPRFAQHFSTTLQRASSCEELEQHTRDATFLRIQADYSARLEYAMEQLHSADSRTCQYSYADMPVAMEDAAPPQAASAEKAASVSETNNQIAQVHEADVVKADTQHMFVAKGNQLRIFKAWPPDSATELPAVPIEGQAKRLLKVGKRLLVVSFVADDSSYGYDKPTVPGAYWEGNVLDPYAPYSSKTILTLLDLSPLDLSPPASPTEIRKINLKARFETARSIDNHAFLVLSQEEPFGLNSFWWPDICDDKKLVSEKKLRADYIRALNKIYQEIQALPPRQLGLHIEDSVFGSSQACNNVFLNPMPDGAQQTSVLRVDLHNPHAPLESATLLSRTGEVFVSEENVYMAVPHWHAPNNPWFENWDEQTYVSLVHKFSISKDNPSPAYVASGIVKGNVLNSFSMDEDKGFLRIATTTPPAWWTNNRRPQENVVSVLRQEGSTLQLHGQLDNIAPSERIYSARFMGDRAYVVTFLQVDPLFTIDLSDPTNPQILGELKVPGFSTYIHPLNANRLLTVGYAATDTGVTQGIQVQLFDVSNPRAPRSIASHTLSRYSSSEAAYNHLGFAYHSKLNLLALPATEWSLHPVYGYAERISFDGVRLLHVNPDVGFTPWGDIPHPEPFSSPYGYYSSPVLRNIFMLDEVEGTGNNFLYSLSNNTLFSTRLPSTLGGIPQPIQKFPLN